jgi:quercetin dioxygenase-like cupin family protein
LPLDQIAHTPQGSSDIVATPHKWPGINTQGVTHLLLDFAVGCVFPLHTHPRATETLLVLKGSVYTGFVSDDNVLYAATLQQGNVILFPRRLQHFQLNVGKETAITFNTLTSQDPGFLFPANQIFQTNIPSAVIEKSFGMDAATVKKITASAPQVYNGSN